MGNSAHQQRLFPVVSILYDNSGFLCLTHVFHLSLVDLQGEVSVDLEDSGYAMVSRCPHMAAQEEEWEANF